MNDDLVVAAIQMNSTGDQTSNLTRAVEYVRQAADQGATLIALPELFPMIADFPEMVAHAEPINGRIASEFSKLAGELKVMIAAGSICESPDNTVSSDEAKKPFNTSLIFDSNGNRIAQYRKIHLFEVEIEGKVNITEANFFDAGCDVSVVRTNCATIGQAICYDLRFPELFRVFADNAVDIALLPSAFTRVTGEAHWKTLVLARAIENQMYVVAPNQVGFHCEGMESFGHSLIVDPWGEVLAQADEENEQIILATVSADRIRKIRTRLPALDNRKLQP